MGAMNSDSLTSKSKMNYSKDENSIDYGLKTDTSINKKNYIYPSSNAQSETAENTKIDLNDKKISYRFEWKEGGNNVKIAGSFLNDWKEKIDMKKNNNTGCFEINLYVSRSVHQFKFIVDKKWVCSSNYQTINDKNNTNNIIDLTNYIPENINNNNDNNKSNIKDPKKKKKKLKEGNDYNCNYPKNSDINFDPPPIPMHYNTKFDLNKQTKQELLESAFSEYNYDISRNQIENDSFKTIMTISHDKSSHICYNIDKCNNDINNKYISSIITQRIKHKFLTIIYYSPKKSDK